VTNLEEWVDQTDPTNPDSVRPRLTVLAANGSVIITPAQPTNGYVRGTVVQLTPSPHGGYEFTGWLGDLRSSAAPLTLVLNSSLTLEARFRVAGDDFAQAVPVLGVSALLSGVNTEAATFELGETWMGAELGGHSLWWAWTSPATAAVQVETRGSDFPTLLGSYRGFWVDQLQVDGEVSATGETNDCRLVFQAEEGETYYFRVDGVGGSTGTTSLAVSMPSLMSLMEPSMSAGQEFSLTLLCPSRRNVRVQRSVNLIEWTDVQTITVTEDFVTLRDSTAGGDPRRFYRVISD
jgi:hypothetical protein